MALTLAELAKQKDISLCLGGPVWDSRELFQREVDRGALRVRERRGEFDEVLDSDRA